jgi:hypothetical protein
LPVRALSRLFRGKFLAGLRQAHAEGRLRLPEELGEAGAWSRLLAALAGQEWVVYSQPPCAGPAVVLKYLARYVHRVAIGNGRLVRVGDEGVAFSYKDYRDKGKGKELTLSGEEFARRFLQHVLPGGFVRIRHYGLLANRGRERKLTLCRQLLLKEGVRQQVEAAGKPAERRCPCAVCGEGEMRLVELVPARPEEAGTGRGQEDTS